MYPGDISVNQKGFHEIIPGLGAFPVRPSKSDSGIGELTAFILEIIDHFIDRASQREKMAFRTFDIHKTPPDPGYAVKAPLPELTGNNRDLIPDEIYVLVGYYKSSEQYDWIRKSKMYNFRMGSGKGSLILNRETVSSRYLLLHTTGNESSGDLWKIVSTGPRVFSGEDLSAKGYPSPSQANYLVIQLEPVNDPEFENVSWDFRKLKNYTTGRASAFPFTASLTELMRYIIR